MSKATELWAKVFNEAIANQQERTTTNPVDWKAAGRATKANPDKENGDWWAENGPVMLENFFTAWDATGWQVWTTPEGVPGIELEFNLDYGDVRIKSFVDLVAVTGDGELIIVDWKTGSNMPSNAMQLALYATAVEKQFGLKPSAGYYYNARNAVFEPADIGRWTIPLFTELFRQFEDSVQRRIFIPNLGMMCKSCFVKDYCYAYGGEYAEMLDPLYAIAQQKEETSE